MFQMQGARFPRNEQGATESFAQTQTRTFTMRGDLRILEKHPMVTIKDFGQSLGHFLPIEC